MEPALDPGQLRVAALKTTIDALAVVAKGLEKPFATPLCDLEIFREGVLGLYKPRLS